jgi:ABC-2 type transport system permease protein
MSLRRIWAVASRIAVQLLRDRRTLGILFIVPAGVLALLGYTLRESEIDLKVAVVAAGQEEPARDAALFLRQALEQADIEGFTVPDGQAGEEALRDGRAHAYLVVDDAFVQMLVSGQRPEIQIGIEGSNPQSSSSLLTKLSRALAATVINTVSTAAGGPAVPPEGAVRISPTYLHGGAEFDTLDNLAPALIAVFAFLFVFALTDLAFIHERTWGTLERLMATPLSRAELMLGYMVGFGLFGLLQSAAILLIAVFGLRVNYAGDLALIFVLTSAIAVGAVNLGIFVSAFARSEFQAIQFLPVVVVPQIILSGVLFPLESLPEWLQWVARAMPLTYAIEALRDVMIEGLTLVDPVVLMNLGAILGFAAFFIFLSASTLRRHVA